MIGWSALAIAGTTGSVEVLVGARGDAEATLEQPTDTATVVEPSGTTAALAEIRRSWAAGPWLGATGELWTYFPEPDPSLVRATPRGGLTLDVADRGHVDLAARYAFQWLPLFTTTSSGRAEGTVSAGVRLGAHGFDAIGTVVDRTWDGTPAWSFRTAEAGVAWSWQPSDWRFGARTTVQANAGFTLEAGGSLARATGQQLRLGVSTGFTRAGVDTSVDYRLYVADEGQLEDAVRPQFTPVGEYDDDADALSAGGFTQHRLSVAVGARSERWSLSADALARLRLNEPGPVSAALSRTAHAAFDIGRRLGDRRLEGHAVLGVSAFDTPQGTGAVDPYGWVGIRWRLGDDE